MASARDIIEGPRGRIHGMGVGGVGMAGIAALLQRRGFAVTGCDVTVGRMAVWLKGQGVGVVAGHDPDHLKTLPLALIRSTAVPADHPEVRYAHALGCPVLSRGAVLAAMLRGPGSVAVCGTHGKTTTSSLLARILDAAGRQPSWCIGGETVGRDRPMPAARYGSGHSFVAEADESDGTLALYAPETTVITNVEFDHMEHFESPAAFEACFRAVIYQTTGTVLYARHDPVARGLCGDLTKARSFGFEPEADVRAVDFCECDGGQSWTLTVDGVATVNVALPFPGRHNALNALGAAAAALVLGVTPSEIAAALAGAGLPRRRFQKVVDRPELTVVSDYAHHPSELAALLRMAPDRRCLVVYQPHRYSRTRLLGSGFATAFKGAADVMLLPVYAASEAPQAGGAHTDLYARMRHDAQKMGLSYQLRLAMNFNQVKARLLATIQPGDCLMIAGAGDVEALAEWAAARFGAGLPTALDAEACRHQPLRLADSIVRRHEPLGKKTMLKVGGRADYWSGIGCESDLRDWVVYAQQEGLPLRVLGGGSNVLVSDFGVDGVVVRLSAKAFGSVRFETDGSAGPLAVVGAAVPLARALDAAEAQGLGGLEFLEGIPGTVGGALAMNAGTRDGCIGERVVWVRGMDRQGRIRTWTAQEMGFDYRCCQALRDSIALEVGWRLTPCPRDVIRAHRQTLAAARAWLRGWHSAGSVFKNPPGHKAGRLLEEAGMKGVRVGGARLSDQHANIAVMDRGGCASDLMALLALARQAVVTQFGVDLETEIKIWERS